MLIFGRRSSSRRHIALVFVTVAIAAVRQVVQADPDSTYYPVCGSPLTLPQPHYRLQEPLDNENGVSAQRERLLLSLSRATDLQYLVAVELVPSHGSVINIKVNTGVAAAVTSTGENYVALPIPTDALNFNTTYIAVVRSRDPDSPPKCAPKIFDNAIGEFTTAVYHRSSQ